MMVLLLAVAWCSQLAEAKPVYQNELYHRGIVHALKGDYAQAEQCFSEALRYEPDSETLWKYRSIARGMLGNVAGAAADWESSIRCQPEHIQSSIDDAYEAQDWPRLLATTEWYLNRKQLAPTGYFYHSAALIGLGRSQEAAPLLKLALQRGNELAGLRGRTHYLYAQVLQIEMKLVADRSKTVQEAIDHYDLAWNHGHQSRQLLKLRAFAYWELNKQDEAIIDVKRAIVHDSKDTEMQILLVSFLTASSRWPEAQDELNWLKRRTMSAEEKKFYAETLNKLEAEVSSHMASRKPGTTAPAMTFDKNWKPKLP